MKIVSPEYRITMGTILLVYAMIIETLDGFSWYHANETVLIAIIGFASGLLSAGIIKQHKSFQNNV